MNISISIIESSTGTNLTGVVHVDVVANPAPIRVEFFLDNVKVSTASVAPYRWTWDTTTAINGSHILRAEAVYKTRRSKAQMAVTVNNVPIDTTSTFGIGSFGTIVFQGILAGLRHLRNPESSS